MHLRRAPLFFYSAFRSILFSGLFCFPVLPAFTAGTGDRGIVLRHLSHPAVSCGATSPLAVVCRRFPSFADNRRLRCNDHAAAVRRFFCFVRLFSPFIASKYWYNVPKRKNKNKESGEKIMKVRYGRPDHTPENGRADFYGGFFPCPTTPPCEHRNPQTAITLPSALSPFLVRDGPQATFFISPGFFPGRGGKAIGFSAWPKGGGMSENVAFACTKVEHEFFNPDSFCPGWVVN